MARAMEHVASAMQTYSTGSLVKWFEIRHYGEIPVFLRGYAGGSYSLGGTLRSLIERGGRDMHATPPQNQPVRSAGEHGKG
jgi:hypothetical protein